MLITRRVGITPGSVRLIPAACNAPCGVASAPAFNVYVRALNADPPIKLTGAIGAASSRSPAHPGSGPRERPMPRTVIVAAAAPICGATATATPKYKAVPANRVAVTPQIQTGERTALELAITEGMWPPRVGRGN